jgi:hypothetical protein
MPYHLTRPDRLKIQGTIEDVRQIKHLLTPVRRRRGKFTSAQSIPPTPTFLDLTFVLIDKDIKGSKETKPAVEQPNTDIMGHPLQLWALELRNIRLKYFRYALPNRVMRNGTGTSEGGTEDSITLASDAIEVDEYYTGATITLSNGDVRTITMYVGSSRIATVDSAWPSGPPESGETYTIRKDDPGYKSSNSGITPEDGTSDTIALASNASSEDDYYVDMTIVITNGPGFGDERTITAYNGSSKVATVDEPWSTVPLQDQTEYEIVVDVLILETKEVQLSSDPGDYETQYKLDRFYYLDGKDFKVGEYTRSDYEEYPENEVFPPDGTGTYPEQDEGFFNKRYRAIAIDNVLIMATCEVLPRPDLIEFGES